MSRHDVARLNDVVESIAAIDLHLQRGDLTDSLIFDAVRMRLIEIGEAVKDVSPGLLASEPSIPWREVAGLRDWLAHRYFDTATTIVAQTVTRDLAPLAEAVGRLLGRLRDSTAGA